jgi:hypothetical protein
MKLTADTNPRRIAPEDMAGKAGEAFVLEVTPSDFVLWTMPC